MMYKSVNKLDGFIKDIINYSRNSRQEVHKGVIDFKDLVEEVFSVLDHLDEENKVRKDFNLEQTGHFHSDRRRLFVVLNNLISNAYHYRNRNAEKPEIRISILANEHKATIKVADNGSGIPAELQEKVFHMFYRGSDKSTGSGLGLYIVKETVNKLKGQITVKSEVNKGTEFTIELPTLI